MSTNNISRRQFLRKGLTAGSAAFTLGFLGCSQLMTNPTVESLIEPYGGFQPDPSGILDLPFGFKYHAFSKTGETMDDGFLVPGGHDGMAAFPGPYGKTILVRNHELETDERTGAFGHANEFVSRINNSDKFHDLGQGTKPALGGTTTLIYNTRTKELEKQFLSLVGTMRNCAGGPTPWNTWISCEESVQKSEYTFETDHGYNFEVPALATGLVTPVPLKAMGRFYHEAVAVDANTGIVYQTEDRGDGLVYRFIPNHPGRLTEGGRLQALKIRDLKSADTRNWTSPLETLLPWTHDVIPVGEKLNVEWVDIQNAESPKDDLRKQGHDKGAARFARGEGMWYSDGVIFFACTNGGERKKGQIWRYTPSPFEGTSDEEKDPGILELFIESMSSDLLENADNLTISPWGDLIVCEDGSTEQFLVGITPEGKLYRFARNAKNIFEFAGSTFSPDGSTLFVNIQTPGITLAITGPWHTVDSEV